MSYRRVTTLGDAIDHGVELEIICANAECGRRRRVQPFALLGIFPANATFARIGRRMVCRGTDLVGGGCGHRGANVRFIIPGNEPDPEPSPGGGNVVPFVARRFTEPAPPAALPRRRRAQKRSHFRCGQIGRGMRVRARKARKLAVFS